MSHDRAGQQFPRAAGVVLPLFSLRGAHDVGTGGILDLIPFIEWLDRWGQRVVQLLPINESAPAETSPYNTLSVFAIDPEYISAARLSDVTESDGAQEWMAAGAMYRRVRRAGASRSRHRRAVHALNRRLLHFGFEQFQTRATPARVRQFEDFCAAQAWWLDDYTLFRALKERFAWRSWDTWPDELRWRDADALRDAANALQSGIRFFRYVQWVAAEQWQTVRARAHECGVLLKGDLAFVCGSDSADVWAHQDLFDPSSSAGAPPDDFCASGQAWGLPLYNWAAMRRTGYEWWRQRVRHARGLYDIFRVDHLVGLYRTYAMPLREGGTSGFVPSDETAQRQQGNDLMRAILEEAGGAVQVVAEDLGTVPPWVRESLTQLGVPGYKVFRWEARDGRYLDPREYPELSIATTGTHDTDTLAEWWEGLTEVQRAAVVRCLDDQHSGLGAQDSGLIAEALLRRLYEAPSALTIVPFQDLFGWRERINTPATVNRRNWAYRLPMQPADLERVPAIRERLELLRRIIVETGRGAR